MKTSPEVLIITPYRADNKERMRLFQERTKESVLTQSFMNFHWLVVDDESPIPAEEALRGVRDSRVEVFRRQRKTGDISTASNGINEGFRVLFQDSRFSDTPFVSALHSDDMYTENGLNLKVDAMRKDERAGFLYTKLKIENLNGGYPYLKFIHNGETEPDKLRKLVWISGLPYMSMLYRKGFIADVNSQLQYPEKHDFGIWDPLIRFGEDREMALQCINAAQDCGWKIISLPYVTATYTTHDNSITGTTGRKSIRADNERIVRRHYDRFTRDEKAEMIIKDALCYKRYIRWLPDKIKNPLKYARNCIRYHMQKNQFA
ncbi:MAG: glycosyltransferase [Candidatus Aenigmarchaeota archaeon]|nr:glycosyltransferase [Candidatus Aenigmarchaeota archaeon]